MSIHGTQSTEATVTVGSWALRIGLVETATPVGRDLSGTGVVVLALLPQQVVVLGDIFLPLQTLWRC